MTTKNSPETYERALARLAPGKCLGLSTDECFMRLFPPGESHATLYEVVVGWCVNESFADDYESHTWHPFRTSEPRPWVGRRWRVPTRSEAALLYHEASEAVLAGRGHTLTDGERIGSVSR